MKNSLRILLFSACYFLPSYTMQLVIERPGEDPEYRNIQARPYDEKDGLILLTIGTAWCLHETCYWQSDRCPAQEKTPDINSLFRLSIPFYTTITGAYILTNATYNRILGLFK